MFTAIHLVGLVADSCVHFGCSEILVPGASAWKTVPVAWGVVAFSGAGRDPLTPRTPHRKRTQITFGVISRQAIIEVTK